MQQVAPRTGARRVAAFIALLCSFVLGAAIFRHKSLNDEWRELPSAFAVQVNRVGLKLEPGGVGSILVPASRADELILLPCYCQRSDLIRRFPERSPALIDGLVSHSPRD